MSGNQRLVESSEDASRRMHLECWWGLWRSQQACGERQQEDRSDADQETPTRPAPGLSVHTQQEDISDADQETPTRPAPGLSVHTPALSNRSDLSEQCRGKAQSGVLPAADAAQLARGHTSEAGVVNVGTVARMVAEEEVEGHQTTTRCSKEGGRLRVYRVWGRARSCLAWTSNLVTVSMSG